MEISVSISALGLNWKWWKQITLHVDEMGFVSIFRGDHFPLATQPTTEALELITSLTYIADHTKRVDFGSLVAPLSFHDPVMLSRQALNLNELSGGRMILGLGSGWQEQEHTRFGYKLGDLKNRLNRLEEGLEVIKRLTSCVETVNFQGHFY